MFTTFFHGTIRKYIVAFGTIFNNIYINRINSTGETVQSMKVPLSYGPKEKFLARLEGDPLLSKPIAIALPRIAFEIVNISSNLLFCGTASSSNLIDMMEKRNRSRFSQKTSFIRIKLSRKLNKFPQKVDNNIRY